MKIKFFKGFSKLELLLTSLLIFLVILFFSLTYLRQQKRMVTRELITIGSLYKILVLECFNKTQTLTACDSGSANMQEPAKINNPYVKKVIVKNGVITVFPHANLKTHAYILTPQVEGKSLLWESNRQTLP